MKCPRCSEETKEMANHDIKIDVCFDGCGGIWFDPYEFKKMDEVHESDDSFLEELAGGHHNPINLDMKINCPRCDSQPMFRHFFSVKRNVEVDECPKCAGVWLDAGELTRIYATFPTEAERVQAAGLLFDDLFGAKLEKLKNETQDDMDYVRRLAHAVRFLSLSYFIKGKEEWEKF